jgi:hypothetical protein
MARKLLVPNMLTCTVRNEVPTGTLDLSNCTFTLVNQPANASIEIFQNGVLLIDGTDYTFSGKTITMTEAPHSNDTLICNYEF